MLFVAYSYGDKFESLDDYGSIGYIKCEKCGKMANFVLQTGTLQNHIDGFLPAGQKRKLVKKKDVGRKLRNQLKYFG